MKYEIMRVYASAEKRFIMIDLFNEEKQLNIELRCCDNYSRDFMRRYDPFVKWLHDMRTGLVRMELDVIAIAFEKFKNAHIDPDISYQDLAEKLYKSGAEDS